MSQHQLPAQFYDSLEIHRAMVRDEVRTGTYGKALASAVKPGDIVLDFGAGTGILSLLAAQAGAKKVYAVERAATATLAQQLIARNGANHRVDVIREDMETCYLPGRVDVLVSEWLGVYGIDENLLAPLLLARDRWLKPGGRILPDVVTAWMAPVWCQKRQEETEFFGRRPFGIDLSLLAAGTADSVLWVREGLRPEELAAEPLPLWTVETNRYPTEKAQLPFRATLNFRLRGTARVNGLAAWFRAEFGDDLVLTNAPGSPRTHWGQYVFPLCETLTLEHGSVLTAVFTCLPSGPGYCNHAWSVRVGAGPCESHDTRLGAGPQWREL